MNVLFFPYWPTNPYQPNLAKALGKKGIHVQGVRDSFLGTLFRSAKGQDILHLHWPYRYFVSPGLFTTIFKAFLFFSFLILLQIRGRKLVWTVHNLGEHEKQHPGIELFCHRFLARLADGIIVHSQYAQKKTIETYKPGRQADKIRVIPHGNYIGNYPNDISREQARARLGIGEDKRVLLSFGQIRPYKGLPELISAFTKIASGNELLFLTGKPLNEQIKEEITQLTANRRDIIFSPEFVSEEEVQVYMRAADAVIFPFRDVFTTGSVLLAMSFGKALIVPELESLAEIVRAGGAITYDSQDKEGLENAIAALVSVDFQKLGHLNYKEAQKLSWDSIAEETAKLYSEIMV